MCDYYQIIFQSLHCITAVTGSFLNIFLMYLALFKSPNIIRVYSTFIINFAITDMLACLLDVFIEIRLLPSPNESTMTYILNGLCIHFGVTTCAVGLSLFIHTLTHSLWSLLLSFSYRYYILYHPQVKRRTVIISLIIFYIPSFIQAVTYWTNFVDYQTILPIVKRIYPEYTFSNESVVVTGILNLFSISAIYAILHMTLPITPVYIIIFILRMKILRELRKNVKFMSKETKNVHAQLLKALTFQSFIPVFAWIGVVVYVAMQFGIIRGQLFEYLIFASVIFMPTLSPITYLLFVRPYRNYVSRLFCRKNSVVDRGRNRFYSGNYDSTITTNNNWRKY